MALKGAALLNHHNTHCQNRLVSCRTVPLAESVIQAGYLRSDGKKASYTNYYTELFRARVQDNARNTDGRKIEMDMIAAIEKEVPFKYKNTLVTSWNPCGQSVVLHHKRIANIYSDKIVIYSNGYKTKTTKSRLNRILMHLCGMNLYQKKGEWFVRDVGEDIPFVEGMEINRI
jgi:hypothetical protein